MPNTLSQYVQRDLQTRIERQGDLPPKLTLADLAAHYGVSLTPVRLAVDALVASGHFVKHANGRLTVNASPPRSQGANEPLDEQPISIAELEQVMVQEIIAASVRGKARLLREESTAERLGVGRTVMRQLFSRLAGQGFIEHLPRRGWRVRTFDEADMQAYLDVREALELKALALARPHLQPAELEAMLAANAAAPSDASPRLDNELHQYLIEKSGNTYIRDFFERYGIYYSALFDYAAPEAQVVDQMAAQHREILMALLHQDWTAARQALARHIRSQRPIVARLMQELAGQAQPA